MNHDLLSSPNDRLRQQNASVFAILGQRLLIEPSSDESSNSIILWNNKCNTLYWTTTFWYPFKHKTPGTFFPGFSINPSQSFVSLRIEPCNRWASLQRSSWLRAGRERSFERTWIPCGSHAKFGSSGRIAATNSAQKLCVAESSFEQVSSAPSCVRIKLVRAMRFIRFVKRGFAAKDSSSVGNSRPGGGREALAVNAGVPENPATGVGVTDGAGCQVPKWSESFRVLAGLDGRPSVVAMAIGAPGTGAISWFQIWTREQSMSRYQNHSISLFCFMSCEYYPIPCMCKGVVAMLL